MLLTALAVSLRRAYGDVPLSAVTQRPSGMFGLSLASPAVPGGFSLLCARGRPPAVLAGEREEWTRGASALFLHPRVKAQPWKQGRSGSPLLLSPPLPFLGLVLSYYGRVTTWHTANPGSVSSTPCDPQTLPGVSLEHCRVWLPN